MKDKIIKVGVLTTVFFVAVIVFSILTNRGNADMTVEMDSATFPTMAFEMDGREINPLVGYREVMNIPAMRDTITPLDKNGQLLLKLHLYDMKPEKMLYDVYTLDGNERLLQRTERKVAETMKLDIGTILPKDKEAVLKITLCFQNDKKMNYYTRIVNADDYHVKECMKFANELHSNMIQKVDTESIAAVIEPNTEGDNTTLQHVTIHSDLEHATWGKLKPEIVGNVQWNLKETNETYSAIQMKYRVRCKGELDVEDTYNVSEYFRIRYLKGKIYLLDYDRTMNQVLDATAPVLTGKGIQLGIVPKNISYKTSQDGNLVAFVQERELWCYNKDADELSLIFSFAEAEKEDSRNLYDQHSLKMIHMDQDGNLTFAVFGYMNRGEHEGEVGAAIYHFSLEQNCVEEKAFIPSNKSFAIAENELGKLVYYNNEQNTLYVLVDGTLYQVELDTEEQKEIVNELSESQYVASDDGHLLAYQQEKKIILIDFQTGKSKELLASEGETIKPLGFIENDFVYGVSRDVDAGKSVSGTSLLPMYKLEIQDPKGTIVKTYQFEQIYISDVIVEKDIITLNRVMKDGELYTAIDRDYITSNTDKKESNISLQEFVTDLKETQYRFVYEDGIEDKKPKILKPKQVLYEHPTVVAFADRSEKGKFFVYGLGRMVGMYDNAGYAVQKANEVSGVVVAANQSYVWERGNRDLRYFNSAISKFATLEGETTLAACIRQALAYEGKTVDVTAEMAAGSSPIEVMSRFCGGEALDLTGCKTEEILYVVSRGTPVIAMTGQSDAVLIVGYDPAVVDYYDPASGGMKSVKAEELDRMVSGSGHSFIGYVKPQDYSKNQ